MRGSGRRSRLQVEDSPHSEGLENVPNPPQRGRSHTAGGRGGRRGRRQMPVQDDQEEIDITISDRSASFL